MHVKFGSEWFAGDQSVLWAWPFTPQTLPSQHLQASDLTTAFVGTFPACPVTYTPCFCSAQGFLWAAAAAPQVISSFLIARNQISPFYSSHLIVFLLLLLLYSMGSARWSEGPWRRRHLALVELDSCQCLTGNENGNGNGQARHIFHSGSASCFQFNAGTGPMPLHHTAVGIKRKEQELLCLWAEEERAYPWKCCEIPAMSPAQLWDPATSCSLIHPIWNRTAWLQLWRLTRHIDKNADVGDEGQIQLPAPHLGGK